VIDTPGFAVITSWALYRAHAEHYGIPSAVGWWPYNAGALFIDDATGRPVAYTPPTHLLTGSRTDRVTPCPLCAVRHTGELPPSDAPPRSEPER